MFTFILMMLLGVLIGYSLRNHSKIRKVNSLIHGVVWLMLGLLGCSIGQNRLIVDHLSYFCGQAAVISLLSDLGSLLGSVLVYHLFFNKKGASHEK